jgi:hypothetical protein
MYNSYIYIHTHMVTFFLVNRPDSDSAKPMSDLEKTAVLHRDVALKPVIWDIHGK